MALFVCGPAPVADPPVADGADVHHRGVRRLEAAQVAAELELEHGLTGDDENA